MSSGGSSSSSRPRGGGPRRTGGGREGGRNEGRSGGRPSDRGPSKGSGRTSGRGAGSPTRGAARRGGGDARSAHPERPDTEAFRRSQAIKKAKAAARADGREVDQAGGTRQRRIPPPPAAPRESASWHDEGPLRAEAEAAVTRSRRPGARGTRRDADSTEVDPDVAKELSDAVGAVRSQRLLDRLTAANIALDRERFDEARRLVTPLVRELPGVAAVHETAGLVQYRLGHWKQAAAALEKAQRLRESVELLPVLADCYRALRTWSEVDRIWRLVKSISPAPEVMSEARIVVAGSLADRGEMRAAISLLTPQGRPPSKLREYHLRQWYALADLCDRAGDTIAAHRWFSAIARQEPDFVDVRDRIRALGR